MSPDHLKEFWNVMAHQINNATANILLEASTLQYLMEKKEIPKEQIIKILKYLDISVEIISASLQEMENIWEKIEKGSFVDINIWEEDFRRRLIQLKEKGIPEKK